MYLITPEKIDPADFTTNVTEDDAAAYSGGTSYDAGDRVIYQSTVYESLIDANIGNTPNLNADKWIRVSPTNPLRMFDGEIGSPTTRADNINLVIDKGTIINGLAMFDLDAATVQVVMTHSIEGEVYNETFTMGDSAEIIDYYAFFYSPVSSKTDLAVTDLPLYVAELNITITKPGGDAKAGEIVAGALTQIGIAEYGTSVSIKDYSRKSVDGFGITSITERPFSKQAQYVVAIPTGQTGVVQRKLAALRATPAVYIGTDVKEETVVYGFY
ncbi:MAG: hypothetical protein ACSHWQ_05010, partial [Spongiibacteraceae bacterium]